MKSSCVHFGALIWAVALLSTSAAEAAQAIAPLDSNVPPRAAATDLKQIAAKRQQLMAAMMRDPSNLDIAFEYASLSAEAGDLEGAISTLERMLIFAPGLPRLDLELGVLYFRLGAHDTALSYFQAALDPANHAPAPVREKVEAYIAAIGKQSQPNQFSGSISFGTQYQTNANGGPSSLFVDLNGLPFVLSQSAASTPDTNAYAAGSFVYSKDLADQGDRFVVGLQSYGSLYKQETQLNTGASELTFGPQFNLQRFHIDDASLAMYGIAGGVLLGGYPYLASDGFGLNVQKGLGPRLHLGLTSEFRNQTYFNSPDQPLATDRNGSNVRLLATAQYHVSDAFSVFAGATSERRNAEAGYLSLLQLGASLGGTVVFASPLPQLADPWSFTLWGGYLQRNHDAPDPIVNVAQAEVEHEFDIQGTLNVPLQQGWSMQTTLSYRDVKSNYDIDNTTDTSALVGFTKQF
ncbi:MAG TPA: tetratricopeptide repeat protein [Devosiaceae bacterium]|nr:tetratricopeptide repeat protein [Devosiaceae bacterium]